MCKQLITYLIILGLAIGISPVQARLVHHWKLDEDTGAGATVVVDSIGGLNGDIQGAQSVPGKAGNALSFDGSDDVVTIQNFVPPKQGTVAFWMDPGFGSSKQRIFGAGGDFEVIVYSTGIVRNELFAGGSGTLQSSPGSVEPGQWFHIAVTYDYDGAGPSTALEVYVNGELDVVGTAGEPTIPTDTTLLLGYRAGAAGGEHYGGLLDDLQIYDSVLSEAEIKALANPPRIRARDPIPPDGAIHEDAWLNLSWTAGEFAISHDVYLGDNFDGVNDGVEGTFAGNQTKTFIVVGFPGFPYPDGLVPGTTYYWRIDEVNDSEPNSPWKGDVWSFSIPPKTAYAPDPADDAESVNPNVELSWTEGFGSKLHTVYFGDNFDDVNNATGGLPHGVTTYDPGTLKLAKTYYWRVDEFDAVDTYKGHVWSFTTEGAVGNPNPANGAVDVKQTQIITFSPSVFAASHELYFGTDKDAVKNADTGSPEYKGTRDLGAESYDPGKLEWDTTYYWRIDEVNSANPDSPWTGILWSFTTANFLIVDDFESYNDLDPADPESNRIFNAWLDGYDDPANGSLVGYETPPFAEQTIVHSGSQSMPLYYDNSVGYSEATLTLTYPRDWTENGVTTLTIWFRGNSDNAAETLYVALNGSAVVTHDNPDAAQITTWMEWTIDLQAFADQGVNLANVNTIALGLGNRNPDVSGQAGGSGTMYIDDIRLYPPPEPAP
jgi:hypothetical protein